MPGTSPGVGADVLLATVGSAGDVLPLLSVARGLARRGLRPHLVTNPVHQGLIEAHGLPWVPLGTADQHRALLADPDLWHPTRGFEVLVRGVLGPYTRLLYERVARCDPRRTLLVTPGVLYGARIAHEKLGLPWVTLHLQPTGVRSAHDPPVLGALALPGWLPPVATRAALGLVDRVLIDRAIGPRVNPLRRELGLPPQRGFFGAGQHAPGRSLGLFADWFAPPQPDWPPQFEAVGFVRSPPLGAGELDPELRAFLDAGEPPVAFTAGTAMHHARGFFAASLDALARLGRRGLFLVEDRDQLPADLPESVHHLRHAPLDRLLPRVAALVHHGGIGTLAEALAAGLPQLVCPLAHDQPDNARRLQRLGACEVLLPGRYRGPRVAAALTRLLTSAPRAARCRELATRVDFDAALERACQVLVDEAPRG